MIGVPYIKSLFSAILAQSKVIDGRFYICPFWGNEINKLNLDEITSWVEPFIDTMQKYPAAILMPMREVGNFQYQDDPSTVNAYSTIECAMVFITNAYVTGQNQVSAPAAGTKQPTHTIPDTWHDMARCAKNFLEVLYAGIEARKCGPAPYIFISEKGQQSIIEVTSKGNDEVSGVMMRFSIGLFGGCDLEDYNSDYLTTIQWPALTDVHPLHKDV